MGIGAWGKKEKEKSRWRGVLQLLHFLFYFIFWMAGFLVPLFPIWKGV